MIHAHYSPYCLCHSCTDRAFWECLPYMTDQEILQHAKRRVMDERQKKLVAMVELRVWNKLVKGEKE